MIKARDAADRSKRALKDEMQIIWDGLDFSWTEWEIAKAEVLWHEGADPHKMCDELRQKTPYKAATYEIFFLLLHLAEEGKIKMKKGSLMEWLSMGA